MGSRAKPELSAPLRGSQASGNQAILLKKSEARLPQRRAERFIFFFLEMSISHQKRMGRRWTHPQGNFYQLEGFASVLSLWDCAWGRFIWNGGFPVYSWSETPHLTLSTENRHLNCMTQVLINFEKIHFIRDSTQSPGKLPIFSSLKIEEGRG